MNTASSILKTSLIAALFAAGAAAQAVPMGDGDTQSGQPAQVQSTQSFASRQAASLASTRGQELANFKEGYGSGVQSARHSEVDRAAVRQAAIRAERSGEIERGDALSF